MRNHRNALAALVFALALSVPAFADDGVMTTDKTGSTPPPSAASTTQDTASDGVILTGTAAPAPQPTDDLTGIALSLLESLALY